MTRNETSWLQSGAFRNQAIARQSSSYGPGGVGKTKLVRALPERYGGEAAVVWLRPVDLDDQEYWLLTNLQTHVAKELDIDGKYFQPYFDYLAQPVTSDPGHVTTEMAVSRIGFGRQLFLECYAQFSTGTGKTVVIIFDTAEAVRGMTLLITLTQWMRALPGTLFVLSGRPMAESEAGQKNDPILTELSNPRPADARHNHPARRVRPGGRPRIPGGQPGGCRTEGRRAREDHPADQGTSAVASASSLIPG